MPSILAHLASPQQLREALAAWGGRLAAADPARQRVRLGTRAAVSLGLALAVMEPLATANGQRVTVVMLAGIVSMVTATSVKDTTRPAALLTLAAATAVSIAVVACCAALSPHPAAADIAFVAVMTGSVLLRRWGQRGFALGQLAFMTYFFALFLEARVRQLPWLSVAVLVGAGATALVRTLLLPDRPAGDLRRSLRALSSRVADLADECREWLTANGPDPADLRTRLLVRAGSRLGEVALLVERQLEPRQAAELVADVDRLRGLVFDVEVAAEQLSDAIRDDGPRLSERARARFAARASRLAAAARAGRPVPGSRDDPLAQTARSRSRLDDAPRLAAAFARVEDSLTELAGVTVTGHLLDGYVPAAPQPTSSPPASSAASLAHTRRTAIQVGISGVLAILAGHAISPSRWFWAVLAAYVVYINASTRTATLRRAFGRVAGTVLGVAGGLLLGKVITGDPRLAVAVIVVLVFAAFWLVAVSYTGLVLCFTLTLAALYSILGTLSWDLMRLRIEETLAGAVIGALVSIVVLPRRGSDAIADDLDNLLVATEDLLDQLVEDPDDSAVRTAVRRLDQTFQDLRLTVQPTVVGLPGPMPQRRRRQLMHAAGVRHWARTLAISAPHGVSPEQAAALRTHLERVRDLVRAGGTADLPAIPASEDEDPAAQAVRHLDESLTALVVERGAAVSIAGSPAAVSG